MFIERLYEKDDTKKKSKMKVTLGLPSELEIALLVKGVKLYCFRSASDVHKISFKLAE